MSFQILHRTFFLLVKGKDLETVALAAPRKRAEAYTQPIILVLLTTCVGTPYERHFFQFNRKAQK